MRASHGGLCEVVQPLHIFPRSSYIALCKLYVTESPYLPLRLEASLPWLPQVILLVTECVTNQHVTSPFFSILNQLYLYSCYYAQIICFPLVVSCVMKKRGVGMIDGFTPSGFEIHVHYNRSNIHQMFKVCVWVCVCAGTYERKRRPVIISRSSIAADSQFSKSVFM